MNQLPERGIDWFSLQRDTAANPYSFDQFIQELHFQIERKIKKEGKTCFDGGYFLKETRVLIEEHQFPLSSDHQQYLPLLTFHATSNVNAARSISKHGYFLPKDIHPTEGYTFKMKNGACFGEGIYSSTVFETAKWFSFIDGNGVVMLFVNLVFLGQVHQVSNDPTEKITTKKSGYNSATGEMWTKDTVSSNPLWDQGILQTIDGKFGNGADTRMRADGHIVVSGSGKNIIPVALLTLAPNWDMQKMKLYLNLAGSLEPFERKFKSEKTVTLYRICEDWHVLEAEKKEKKVVSRHILIADMALARNAVGMQQLSNFYGALASEKSIYIFDGGNTDTSRKGFVSSTFACNAESADGFLGNHVKGIAKLVSDEQWLSNFLHILSFVFEIVTNSKTPREEIVFNIYIFLNRVISVSLLEQFVAKYAPLLENARQVGIKLIFTEEFGSIDYDWVNRFKNPLQTVHTFEALAYHIRDPTQWSNVIDTILEESRNSDHLSLLTCSKYQVPEPLGIIGEGFVIDVEHNPLWNLSCVGTALFKGFSPISHLLIDGTEQRVKYISRAEIIALIEDNDESWIRAKKRDAADVAVRRARRREAVKHYALMLSAFSSCVVQLLCRFRAFVMRSADRYKLYEPAVRQLCESVIQEVSYIDESEELRSFCDMSRLSTCCHQMQRLLSDISVFSGVKFKGVLFDRLMQMKFAKSVLKRADSSVVVEEESMEKLVQRDDKFEKMMGSVVKVFVPASAQIEPWNVVVKEFEKREISVREAIVTGKTILLNVNYRGTMEEKWIYGHIFMGNPYLFLPGQPRSLLTVTWIRCLELFFRRNDARMIGSHNSVDFATCYELSLRVAESFRRDAQMADLVMRIIVETDAKNIAALLTEGSNVISPCKLLGALLRPTAASLFSKENSLYSNFAFAFLAECIMRNCRAYLKSFATKTVKDIVRSTLGIDETNFKTFQLDLTKATLKTGAFYSQQFTNCSPFGLVAALGFIRMIHEQKTMEEMRKAFDEGAVSMRLFLMDNSKMPEIAIDNLARKTQLALFLQGIRLHKSNMRQNIVFDPEQIIRDSISEQQISIASEQNTLSANASRKTIRLERRIAQATPFLSYHKHVKIFTPAEVDEFNLKLGMEKRNEWAIWDERSGLLRHHCCYPDCPDYMHNFATKEDLENNTRKGIMNHLQFDGINKNYVPRFHMMAKVYANRESFNVFVDAMDRKFKDCLYYGAIPRDFMLEALRLAFDRYKK